MNKDYDEDALSDYLESEQFREDFKKQVEKNTWDKGLPKIYVKNGQIIKHWKNGNIEIIKENG